MRAAGEVETNDAGEPRVDIVSEQHWYRWMFTRERPRRESYPVHLVWVEG